MLACMHGNTCRSFNQPNGDGVVFKNIKTHYSPNDVVLVEYILSPKVVTSSKDYIGLYPRGWKSLKQFVAFESTIISPSDEPSLFRSIEFHPRFRVDSVTFFRDYQFIYVTHTFHVLGSSIFFQFHPDCETDGGPEQFSPLESFRLPSPENQNRVHPNKSNGQTDMITGSEDWTDERETEQDRVTESSSVDIATMTQLTAEDSSCLSLLTPEEIAYNECFFLLENSKSGSETPVKKFAEGSLLDEASNALLMPKTMAVQTVQTAVLGRSESPRRGRALVKTKDNSTLEFRNVSPSPPPLNRTKGTKADNPAINFHSPSAPAKNSAWTITKPVYNVPMQYHQDAPTSSVSWAPLTVSSTATGAIPKRCGKCKCPSDYFQIQRKLEHQLKQAHEEIHDLKAHLDCIKRELEMAKVGQAKQRLLRDLVKHEARDVTTFVNNLMASLTRNETVRIVNFDSTVMEVTRQIVSPGYLIRRSAPKTFVYGRPANVKIMSPRHKEMKAIIGHQEMKIRDLHAKLNLTNDLLAKSTGCHLALNLESSHTENVPTPCSTPLTSGPCGDIVSVNTEYDGALSPLPYQPYKRGGGRKGRRASNCSAAAKKHSAPMGGAFQGVSACDKTGGLEDSSSSSLSLGFERIQNELEHVESAPYSADIPGPATVTAPELISESFVVEPVFYPSDEAQYGNREVIADEEVEGTRTLEYSHPVQGQSDSNNNNNGSKCGLCEPDGGDHEGLDSVVSDVGKLGIHQDNCQNYFKGL